MTSSALEQAVVLCGGVGSRLREAVGDLPKILVPIAGRPLLAHLLDGLAAAGTRDVLLLAGHGGTEVARVAGELAPMGMRVEVLVEPAPRGTAGALHGVADRLAPRFLLLFGDVYTQIDWRRFADFADERGGVATLLVHRTNHPEDSDVVALDDGGRVVAWARRGDGRRASGLVTTAALGNAAVAALHRDLLQFVPRGRSSDLYAEVLPSLVDARKPVHGYTSSEYVRDFGTPRRLQEVETDVRRGRVVRRADLALLDRDGVLTEDGRDPVVRPDQLRLLPGAARAVRLLNEAGILTALVTNQAVVARGRCTLADLESIHARLGAMLAAEGARIDLVLACPHHPETQFPEGIAELRGPCECRKPRTGMVERALGELDVPAWRAVVIGDATVDLQLARNAGLASIALATGKRCEDAAFPARSVWRFGDLGEAARWLAGGVGRA
jgi:histidinol-phosphate phosphatase family protein